MINFSHTINNLRKTCDEVELHNVHVFQEINKKTYQFFEKIYPFFLHYNFASYSIVISLSRVPIFLFPNCCPISKNSTYHKGLNVLKCKIFLYIKGSK